jgi:anion transporter
MTAGPKHPVARGRSVRSRLACLALGVVVAAVVALLPTPDGLSVAGQRAIAVTLLATVLWSTEALPVAATALACVALLPVVGATPTIGGALVGFAQPVPYFLYSVLALGLAAGRSGLAERVARWFLALARSRPDLLYWQLICSFVALAFVLPSASTRTGLQLPIYHEALLVLGAGPGSRLGKAVMQALAQLNRFGSNALLTGGVTPVTAAALIGGLGWVEWFVLMALPVYALLGLGAVAVYVAYRPFEQPVERTAAATTADAPAVVAPPVVSDGSLLQSRPTPGTDVRACAILLVVSALWLTDAWHGLDPAVPALFGVVLMVMPVIGVMSWSEVERGVGVGLVFVIAASLSLAQTVVSTGGAAWLGAWLVAGLRPFVDAPLVLVTLLMLISLVARALLSSITAFLTVLIPLVAALAQAIGLNPLPCCLLVTLVGDAVVYYAAQSSSSLMPFEYDYLTAGDVLRFGLLMSVVAVVVGLLALPYWAWLGQPLIAAPR